MPNNRMTVIGSVNAINKILQHFNPNMPWITIENIEKNDGLYILNGILVELIIMEEE